MISSVLTIASTIGATGFKLALSGEETGIAIRPTGIVTVVDSVIRDAGQRPQFHYTLVEISAEWMAGEAIAADDVDDVCWATPATAVVAASL